MNPWLVAVIVGIAVLVVIGANRPAMQYSSPDASGTMSVTQIGCGQYKFALDTVSDSGRAINFYYGHPSPANLLSASSDVDAGLPDIPSDATYTVQDNQMFLDTGCIKSMVGIEQPLFVRFTAPDGGYAYVMGVIRNFGYPWCGPPGGTCQADCDRNVGSATSGYVIIQDVNATCGGGGGNTTTQICGDGICTPPNENHALCPQDCAAPTPTKNIFEIIMQWITDGWNTIWSWFGGAHV